jgi:hypothetical protein
LHTIIGYIILQMELYPSKETIEETLVDGKVHKLLQKWWKDGQLAKQTTYVNDQKHGVEQERYKNGSKKFEATYVNANRHGLYQEWHENGQIAIKAIYVNGQIHGLYQGWWSNGHIKFSYEYENDTLKRIVDIYDDKGRSCILPEGEITVWKICDTEMDYAYVRLTVPKEARRVTPINKWQQYKARVEYAKVEQIIDKKGNEYNEATSYIHNRSLKYKVGEIVKPDKYDDDIRNHCGPGINVHLHKDHCDQWLQY